MDQGVLWVLADRLQDLPENESCDSQKTTITLIIFSCRLKKNLWASETRTSWSSWSSLWSRGTLRTRTKFHLHFCDNPHCVKRSLILTSFPSSPGSPCKIKFSLMYLNILKTKICSFLQNLDSRVGHQTLVGQLALVSLVILAVPQVRVRGARLIHSQVEPPPLQDQEAQGGQEGLELQGLLFYQKIQYPNFPVKTYSR